VTTEKSNSKSDDTGINRREYLSAAAAGTVSMVGYAGAATADGQGGDIPLASFCPLSGSGAAFGPGQQAGFNLAVQDANDAGGPLGRQINPINRDSETKPSRAAAKLQSVISNQNIPAFVGTWSSGVASTLAPIAGDNQIMQVGNGTTSPTLAQMGWREVDGEQIKFMGRTSPNDGAQGLAMGGVLNERLNADSAAFMFVDNPYGSGLAEKARSAFDGETTAMVAVSKQTSDYTSALDKVFADDPDVFGLIVYPANGESILKQWNRGGYGGTLLMSESMFLPDLFNQLSNIVADSYITTVRPKRSQSYEYFTQEMNSPEGIQQEPTTFSSHSYDAALLLALAMHKAGEASGVPIAQNIKSVSRPPGEDIFAGPDEFDRAKSLLDEGSQINYQGASSLSNLNCFVEPYNRFSINKLNAGDGGINVETLDTIEASFFEGKLYSDDMMNQYCSTAQTTTTETTTTDGG
jgi:branched-chain amino acid transport system substrate-binding protein